MSDSSKSAKEKETYQIGSVTAMTKGLFKFNLNSGQNFTLSSYLDHHLRSSVSFRRFLAMERRIAGAYVSLIRNIMTNDAPEEHKTSQFVQRQPRY
jgi:hypothetical protein